MPDNINGIKKKRRLPFASAEAKKTAINLMNSGHSYNFIANKFRCNRYTVKKFRKRMEELGVIIKPLPRDGGVQPAGRKIRGYVRLFDDPEITQKGIDMINAGYTYSSIGKILGCDHTSVMAFHQRKINQGIIFTDFRGKRPKLTYAEKILVLKNAKAKKDGLAMEEINIDKVWINGSLEQLEKINRGKSYEEYLEDYKKETDAAVAERMAKAKETITELRKWRKDNNMDVKKDWTLGRL